jgi:hypothetical protein
MRIALQVIAFNVDPWINSMLRNAAPFVDKIFIAYPPRPWGYSSKSRDTILNPTKLESINISDLQCDVQIVHGDWLYDEDTRNCLLELARSENFDWMVIQDADEFYTECSWRRLLLALNSSDQYDLLVTPWFNFWKSPEYVIYNRASGIKCLNDGFAVRARNSSVRFSFSRTTNAKCRLVIDEPCYHYGYVMCNESMNNKIKTWAHTNDIFNIHIWYELKWLRWDENTLFLHPGSPSYWLKAIRFPLPQPDFANEFLTLPPNEGDTKGVILSIMDLLWNLKAIVGWRLVQFKRLIRNTIINFLPSSF